MPFQNSLIMKRIRQLLLYTLALMCLACTGNIDLENGGHFEPNYDNVKTEIEPLAGATISVAELEKRIGGEFSFFPDAPEKVKESFDPSDWPGLTDVINDPLNSSFDLDQIFGY